ncbi:MAG TPA: hypothetical protein PKB06_00135, partial [Actinotalea sp.]|nr:hypothetical protein [Actinotalea sp.]
VTPVAPVVALTLACAVLALTGTVQATVAAGQEEGSWRAVGADVLVTGPFDPGLPDLRDLAGTDGVTAVAPARVVPGVQLLGSGVDRGARLVAVDPYDLAQVLSAGPLPDAPELAALSATEGAPADGAVPALVTGLPGGAEVTARWGGVSVPLTVADAAPWLPLGEDGGSPSRLTVVVSRADLERALGEPVTTTAAWLVGPGAATAAAQAELGGADVLSRERWLRDLRTGPSVATVTTVLRAAFVLVAALALLVVALTAAGRAPERGRSVLALRVLGAPRVVAGRLALVELLGVVLPPAGSRSPASPVKRSV